MPSPPQTNSILNLLNPYASPNQSTRLQDPDSPSAVLLQELSGERGPTSPPIPRHELSPTPTSSRRLPSHVISNSASSSDDEDAPPRSIVYGEGSPVAPRLSGERTPRSPGTTFTASTSNTAPYSPNIPRPDSPGPFRPSSSSDSGRSRSTSPGPSTISIYASGLEGTALHSTSSIQTSSRDPSTSPDTTKTPQSRLAPTFREPPTNDSVPPPRVTSGSKRASPRIGSGTGYLDPSFASSADRKGKQRAKKQGGRKYISVPAEDADDRGEEEVEEPVGGRYAGFGVSKRKPGKEGLDEYETALWSWVNVEDLDGFLQEVTLLLRVANRPLISGVRLLQGQGNILYSPGSSLEPLVSKLTFIGAV
jgi:autophagy-related protein 9